VATLDAIASCLVRHVFIVMTILQDLALDDFSKKKLEVTGKELQEERAEAKSVCED